MKQGLSDALRKHDNALLALPVQHQKEPPRPAKRTSDTDVLDFEADCCGAV